MRGSFTGSRNSGSSGGGGMLGARSGSSSGGGVDKHNFYKLSAKARFEKIMWEKKEERIQKVMEKICAEKGKEGSKKLQKYIEMQKQKRARKQAKKEKAQEMEVKACNFNGGRVDSRGNIYDATGKVIGKVNLESKKVSIGFSQLGKFKNSASYLSVLERAVAAHNAKINKSNENKSFW